MKEEKFNKILFVLFFLNVIGAIADASFTHANLSQIGYQMEGNPWVSNLFIAVGIKVAFLIFLGIMCNGWKQLPLTFRHFLLTFMLLTAIGQFLGAYSHFPSLKALDEHQVKIYQAIEDNGVMHYQTNKGNFSIQLPTKTESTKQYFWMIFKVMYYPFIVSFIAFLLTMKASPDLTVKKNKKEVKAK